MEITELKNTIKKVKTHWLAQSYQVEMTEDGNPQNPPTERERKKTGNAQWGKPEGPMGQ